MHCLGLWQACPGSPSRAGIVSYPSWYRGGKQGADMLEALKKERVLDVQAAAPGGPSLPERGKDA